MTTTSRLAAGLCLLAALAACAAPKASVVAEPTGLAGSAAPPAPPPVVVAAAPGRPALALPPAPADRDEAALWAEALKRGEALALELRATWTELAPPPIPPEVLAPAKPEAPAAVPAAALPVPAADTARVPAPVRSGGLPSVRALAKYTTDTGLPSNRVTALFVDDTDAWVGTADKGVARLNFAERNWIVIQVEDGLSSNRVTDIIRFKDRVFVATEAGVSVWDGVSWKTQEEAERVELSNAVFEIDAGVLWVAGRTMRGGLATFDGQSWKNRTAMRPGILLNNITDLSFAGGSLWLGTTNRGVYRFDGKEWATFSVADGLASNFVYTVAARGTEAFLGGCCGVSAFESAGWRIYDTPEGLPHSTVNAIVIDGELVWFGSKKGLGVFDGGNFDSFHVADGLTDDRITCLFVKGQDVWVGTANGLTRLEKAF